jgi:drug/metabolite transporter (DMT)-like permease
MWAGAQIAFFMFGGYVFQTVGLKFTTPSKAAFITGSSVVLVPIFLATFGRLHFNLWTWAGASTALAGLYFVTVPVEGLSGMNLGDPLVVGCAVMFALHIIFVGRYAQLFPVSVLSFLQIAATAAFSLVAVPLAAVAGWEHPHLTLTGGLIFAVLVTAIGSTVIAFSLQVWAQQNTSASHTALLLSLEPVAAALTSWLLGSEHFGRRILLGAALILFGILLAELKGLTAVAPESPEPAARSPR